MATVNRSHSRRAKPQRPTIDAELIGRTAFCVHFCDRDFIEAVEICEDPAAARAFARGWNNNERDGMGFCFAGIDALVTALAEHLDDLAEGGAA